MKHIGILKNTVQPYAWGSVTAIPKLLGRKTPSNHPQAELWMGAHPAAPSLVHYQDRWTPLPVLLRDSPKEILGNRVVERFGPRLPFLFKVLAAATPLSIQAHPNLEQARQGFEKENALGIPLDAPHRNYKDGNHKPECICALTPFTALTGFRGVSNIRRLLGAVAPPLLTPGLNALARQPDIHGLKAFFTMLMTLERGARQQLIDHAVSRAVSLAKENNGYQWMLRLHERYPADVGVLSPLLLNLVRLMPGQAMFLPAGELHAYLDGVGIEAMANSDNVLRGGLTPKHVDVAALLSVLTFEERTVEILSDEKNRMGDQVYAGKAREFVLSVIRVSAAYGYAGGADRSVEILICTQGEATIIESDGGREVPIKKGISVIIPAAVASYGIEGAATLYKATVP
jgi:mannose-6-phosphate isomerase